MSNKCGNCDCSDSSQCGKKGNSYGIVVETEKSCVDAVFIDGATSEHNGKCKCGDNCACVNCTCGQ